MRGRTGLLFVGIAVLLSSSYVSAQSMDNRVINSSENYSVVECEPGSIPETSIIDKTRNDIARVLNPEGYEQKYPGECSIWTKKYVLDNGGEVNMYQIEVVKYLGDGWKALISVHRDGEGVGYTDIDMEKKEVGATNPHGHLKTELPGDNFTVMVDTSDGLLELEGNNR